MDPWIIFDLLPLGPVADEGQRLKRALQRVPESVAIDSVPILKSAIEEHASGEITVTEGLNRWLRYVGEEHPPVAEAVSRFTAVAAKHSSAIARALEPLIDDIESLIS